MKIKLIAFLILNSSFLILNTSIAQMYWNQAGNFPGTNGSFVAVPSSSSLNITGSFTLEAWINPSTTPFISKGIITKGSLLGISYGIRTVSGRIILISNTAQRLISRPTNLIPVNSWTHVAGTYDGAGVFKIFINGTEDTSATVAGANPIVNPDSLFIGATGSGTEFAGKIDEVRIWNTNLTNLHILSLMKSSLGISGDGFFNNLMLSIPFQNNTGSLPYLSTADFSGKNNNGFIRNNITAFDMKDIPSRIQQLNDCAYFPISGAAFIGPNNSAISPTTKLTLECWVFPKADNYGLIFKGNTSTFFSDYGLKIHLGKLSAYINNNFILSNDSVKKERWSHVAFTYFAATGAYEFFLNGKRGTTGNIAPANIIDGPDSLLIGSHPMASAFIGFMDEVRITGTVKTAGEINSQMFTSVNESNDNDALSGAVYNLDASTFSSITGGPKLNLRGNAGFSLNGALLNGFVQSPVNNFSTGDFQSGYYLNMPNKRIPTTGTTGTTKDTLEILSSESITDLNIFVALNHSAENNLRLTLTSPIGASTEFFANTQLAEVASNIVTVFDSDADSSLQNNRYINFGPKIKPQFDLDAIFSGANSKGKWILTINDDAGSDTGFITSWGLQINNNPTVPFNLECTSLMEGFYNSSTNSLTADTMRFYLHSTTSPYPLLDSSKSKLNSSGTTLAAFTKAQPATDYFLVLRHRNSIETWSSTAIKFTQFTKQATYNFSDALTKAFGNNMIQVDNTPVRFAAFGGDANQDGFVDATDIIDVFNDLNNLTSGYVRTDMNGDDFVDSADLILTYNNSINIVGSITP